MAAVLRNWRNFILKIPHLGWVSPGDTVPEFEQAMNALEPNQVSEPVQSPFGWHLIQVLARRSQDVSQERQRQTARQSIRTRKADEAFQAAAVA